MININTKIEDIVKLDNAIMEFFNSEKIDFCCNGHKTIEEVADEKSISPQSLLKNIEESMKINNSWKKQEVDLEEFERLSLQEMVDSLLVDHHNKERDLLFEIDPLLNKNFFFCPL